MSKKSDQNNAEPQIPLRLKNHLEALGGLSLTRYKKWCKENQFEFATHKTHTQLQEELAVFRQNKTRKKRFLKLDKYIRQFIVDACDNKLIVDQISRPIWRAFFEKIVNSNPHVEFRESLKQLLLRVEQVAGFLTEEIEFGNQRALYVEALIRMNDRKGQWLRPVAEWSPKSHNSRKQFSSLARHLFAQYPLPVFMDFAWLEAGKGAYTHRDWFIHLAVGKNIRTAKTPTKLTKKMSHYFVQAPDDYLPEEAIRWGQIHALGGDKRLTEAILGTPIGTEFGNDAFWRSVILFFIENPFIERQQVGPIIDYINHQKYLTQENVVGPGVVEIAEPPQPNFSMRKRNPNTLLRLVSEWHNNLSKKTVAQNLYFRKSGINEYISKPSKNQKRVWRIIELLSGYALIREGDIMHHCIATYANACAAGKCSIWSMMFEDEQGKKKLLTIEVNRDKLIVEARGKYNRWPNSKEFRRLKDWAKKEDLKINKYIKIVNE